MKATLTVRRELERGAWRVGYPFAVSEPSLHDPWESL